VARYVSTLFNMSEHFRGNMLEDTLHPRKKSVTTHKTLILSYAHRRYCLTPNLPSGIASHVYFLKLPREGRSVILLMRLYRPGQWFLLSPEKLYFSSRDSVLLEVRHNRILCPLQV
jgi:hypothetical protein